MASSSLPPPRTYDVFLSFRGEDTRKDFLSHLYEALCKKGIHTFKDDRKLEKGDSIPNELARAIHDSSFAIVVVSKNYASSSWCLEELRMIMELLRMKKLLVFPIFYEVVPSDVRKQEGSFGKSFETYKDPKMAEKVQKWREALIQVANLSGVWFLEHNEANMIEEIVGGISSRLLYMRPIDLTNLVGMDAHMERMNPLLDIESENEVRMIGICGMPGIGKTAIAKYLYSKFSNEFPGHCFMEDVKGFSLKHGLLHLQELFLSRILDGDSMKFWSVESGSREIKARLASRRVFVVLDDVDNVSQLHALAQKTSWFGPGSRIVITTRDKGVLNSCGVKTLYPVKCLEDDDALQMFKQATFEGGHCPSDVYEELSIRASRLARGLPSALVKYSKFLRGRPPRQWEEALSRYKRAPPKNIMEIFKISYEGLDETYKRVFLHAACLFNGDCVQRVTTLLELEDEKSGVNLAIDILAEKYLVDISTKGCITMHDLVEQTGRDIVRQESKDDPRKQRIWWDHGKICRMLTYGTGTNRNEGISLHMCEIPEKWSMSESAFEPMYNLRFLKFYKHFRRFHLGCLVELNLRYSNLEKLWEGNPELKNLRRLDLTGSKNLKELPDLSKAKKLEELKIEGCTRLNLTQEYIDSLPPLKISESSYCDGLKSLANITRELIALQERSHICCHQTIHFTLTSLTNLSVEDNINTALRPHLAGIDDDDTASISSHVEASTVLTR